MIVTEVLLAVALNVIVGYVYSSGESELFVMDTAPLDNVVVVAVPLA